MKSIIRTLATLAAATMLTACSLGSAPTQAVPTVNIEPTLNAARTQAAATVEAKIASMPTATELPATATTAPSATPIPTNTALPATNTPIPQPQATSTNTAVPTAKATVVVYTSTPVQLGCKITASSVTGESTKAPGSDFDAKWTIQNTGINAWAKGSVDYKYSSGTKMQKKADIFDLNIDVASGASVEFVLDMVAPATPGTYQTNWAVVSDGKALCTLPVIITVK